MDYENNHPYFEVRYHIESIGKADLSRQYIDFFIVIS